MRDHAKSVRLRLGRNVQRIRRLRSLSQERLAELAGTSLKQIGRVERGEANVTVDLLIAIASGLRAEVCDLFDPENDRPGFVLIPAQDADATEHLLKIIDRSRSVRTRARRQRSR